MEKEFAYTRVFWENLNAKEKIIINVGGARSTKSYSIMQLFAYKMITEKNKIFLISRKNFPSLRRSVYKDFIEILNEWGIYNKNNHSKEQGNHHYRHNSNIVYFISIDDASKMRSFKCNYAFFEEANDFEFEDFFQVFLRTNNTTKTQLIYPIAAEPINEKDTVEIIDGFAFKKKATNIYAKQSAQKNQKVKCLEILEPNQLFMALNPDEEHNYIWDIIVEKFPNLPEPISVKVIHSTYKDNPFLDDAYIASLEATKHFNPDYYKIYALGERAKLKGIIHSNYAISDTIISDKDADSIAFGVDFGGSAPSCVLKLYFKKGDDQMTVYVEEVVYKSHMRTSEIIEVCKNELIKSKKTIYAPFYCDSASPERIAEMCLAGINALPATDIKKSITFGWDIVNDHKLVISSDAINTIREIKRYSRMKNKDGVFIDAEVPGIENHAMAALRYGIGQHRHEAYIREKQIFSINATKLIEEKLERKIKQTLSEKNKLDQDASPDEPEQKLQPVEAQPINGITILQKPKSLTNKIMTEKKITP